MRFALPILLFCSLSAYAAGVPLGPPPPPPEQAEVIFDPIPQATVDCINAALGGGLNPVTECNLS